MAYIAPDVGLLLLRLAISAVFLYHAYPKLLKSGMMAKGMGAPAIAVLLLGAVKGLSGIAVLVGTRVEIAGSALAVVMIGAIGMKMFKWKMPFSAMDKMGWEFDLTLLAANLALVALGPGSISYALF